MSKYCNNSYFSIVNCNTILKINSITTIIIWVSPIISPNAKVAIKSKRPVYFGTDSSEGGVIHTTVYDRPKLPAGSVFNGPAIVEEPDCTTVIQPSWSVTVDDFGNLLIEHNQ